MQPLGLLVNNTTKTHRAQEVSGSHRRQDLVICTIFFYALHLKKRVQGTISITRTPKPLCCFKVSGVNLSCYNSETAFGRAEQNKHVLDSTHHRLNQSYNRSLLLSFQLLSGLGSGHCNQPQSRHQNTLCQPFQVGFAVYVEPRSSRVRTE